MANDNSTAVATRGEKTDDAALGISDERSSELSASYAQSSAQYEIQSAMAIARRFPRNEDRAFGALINASKRFSFAVLCCYKYPRGDTSIEGASVNLAREGARVWGNIQYGVTVVGDDEDQRHIRGFAWDLETNNRVVLEDSFRKLVFRKKGGWVKPDERDLRELTNRRGAILERNCLLKILPKDMVEEAIAQSKRTIREGVSSDLGGSRKQAIKAFAEIGVGVLDLEEYLGHSLDKTDADEIAELRMVYKSIADGNSKWAEYMAEKREKPAEPSAGPVKINDLTGEVAAQKE